MATFFFEYLKKKSAEFSLKLLKTKNRFTKYPSLNWFNIDPQIQQFSLSESHPHPIKFLPIKRSNKIPLITNKILRIIFKRLLFISRQNEHEWNENNFDVCMHERVLNFWIGNYIRVFEDSQRLFIDDMSPCYYTSKFQEIWVQTRQKITLHFSMA
jgi:hypothetical protein